MITIEDAGIPKMLASYARAGLDVLNDNLKRELFKGRITAAWAGQVLPDLRDLFLRFPTPRIRVN